MFDCRRKCLRIALLAGVLGTLGATRSAHANTNQCLPSPATVPGLSGAPEWQDFNADGFWRPELDDPRWAGGPLQYLSSLPIGGHVGTENQVAMRAVTVGKILYLSIQAEADDNGPSSQDLVYVAFSQGELAGAYALSIDLRSAGTVINPPANPAAGVVVPADNPLPTQVAPAAITYYHADNARTDPAHLTIEPVWGGENDGMPSWLKAARWDRPVLGSPRWAITLQIDLSAAGLNIAGPTNLFVAANVHTSTGDVIVGNATPKVGTDVDKLDVTPIPKRTDLWPLYDEPGTACTGGITVDPADVGVWTGSPGVNGSGTLTNQVCTGSGCAATENTFRVTVRHVPNNGGIDPWDIRVRLRLAGWDTQAAHEDDAPWSDVATTPTGTQIVTSIFTNDFTAANGWYWAPPVDAGDGTSSIAVDYKCTKGGAAFCPQLADMSNPHQAVSVELAVPSGMWTISKAAAYRDLDFTTASGGAGAGGAPSGGAPNGGAPSGGAPNGGAPSRGAPNGGAPNGGAPNGAGGAANAGSDAGEPSVGGTQSLGGASSGAAGSPAAGVSGAQGGVGNAAAGTSAALGVAGNATAGGPAAPASKDKGGSCGCRLAESRSSKLGDLAVLCALGIALRRRRRRSAHLATKARRIFSRSFSKCGTAPDPASPLIRIKLDDLRGFGQYH